MERHPSAGTPTSLLRLSSGQTVASLNTLGVPLEPSEVCMFKSVHSWCRFKIFFPRKLGRRHRWLYLPKCHGPVGCRSLWALCKLWTWCVDSQVYLPLAQYDPKNPVYSHFTQVVWKSTTQVGCAVAKCSGIFDAKYGVCPTVPSPGVKTDYLFDRQPAQFYVCEYSPPGNVIGEFA